MKTEYRICSACGEPISDKFLLEVSGRSWHARCLRCSICQLQLDRQPSCFIRDRTIYCKTDYAKYKHMPMIHNYIQHGNMAQAKTNSVTSSLKEMPINCSKCFEKLKISNACENCSVPLHVKCGNRIDSDGETNILVCTKCVDDPAAMMAKTENELNHSSSSVETIIGRDCPNDDSLNATVLLKENLLLKQIIEQMTERIELMCFKIGVLELKRESSPLTNRVTEVATTPEAKPSMNTKIPNENGNIKSSTSNHGENKWNTVDSSGFKKKKRRNQLADRNTQDTLEVRIVDDVDVNNANSTNLNVQQKTSSAAIGTRS
ncbi:hypothetical protein JTB14_008904 [Gonioctena quinquepunctata]|nr:hypothetical protein JTB14_008904 [Gonioctena quinquepunctata]